MSESPQDEDRPEDGIQMEDIVDLHKSYAGKDDDARMVEALGQSYHRLTAELSKVIVGMEDVVEQVLVAVFCRGHCILEGVPGLAKTLLVSTVAGLLHQSFKRIQFTPDLMPADITGTDVLEEDHTTGKRIFRFIHGPIFANVILADEINRTPPKTQAALLEAMQERQVTVGESTFPLPDPFFVLATQNPIEQEGTYPLPEAQLDRFMFKIRVAYPTAEDELTVMKRATSHYASEVEALITGEQILRLQDIVRRVPVADHVFEYARNLVRATRPKTDDAPTFIDELLSWGAGPRASIFLILGAKARAILHGRFHATTDDVRSMAHPVLRHRIITTFNAEAAGKTPDDVIDELVAQVPVVAEDRLSTA